MTEDLFDRAKERADSLGLTTFSAYVVQLIRADVAARGAFVLSESDAAKLPPESMAETPIKGTVYPVPKPTRKPAKKKP